MSGHEAGFDGRRVAAFEGRRAAELERLIDKHGGRPAVTPALREAPLEESPEAIELAHRVITGEVDLVILLTGAGFERWIELAARRLDRQRLLDALADATTVARGPKTAAAMRRAGVRPTYAAPAPSTWREVLAVVDRELAVAGRTVGLQEYGEPNPSLIAGLEARGARVFPIRVYQWALPENLGPLRENVLAAARGEREVWLFTAAPQAAHVMRVAEEAGVADRLREAAARALVASIGETTSEALRRLGLPVDLTPERPNMGRLVAEAAARCGEAAARKRRVANVLARVPEAPGAAEAAPWRDSLLMRALRREPTERTPIWLMRQAGRYMEEYRRVRSQVGFLQLCKRPDLCSEIMVTAVKRLGVDAAIIFSDLLPILEPMGLELEFARGEGPVIHNPVREAADVDRVLELDSVDAVHFVIETVERTRRELPPAIPLIGFAGAPFTLASYAVEGGASRNYLHTKTLMYRDQGAWRALLERFARAVARYLNAQLAAGAQCVQLFDSWVGCLGPDDYRRYVLPVMRELIASIRGGPVIHFGTGNPALLPLMAEAGGEAIGVDWRVRLDDAWRAIGPEKAIQGNLDPAVLLSSREQIRRRAQEVLDQAGGRPGHIFNLGHGVLQQTPVDHARALVDAVHELSRR